MHAKTRRMLAMRSAKKSRHRQRNGNGAPPRRISATRSSHKTAMPLCSQDLVATQQARRHHHIPRKAKRHAAREKGDVTCASNKKGELAALLLLLKLVTQTPLHTYSVLRFASYNVLQNYLSAFFATSHSALNAASS